MQVVPIDFKIIILTTFYKKKRNFEKGVPQTVKIFKLEFFFLSQLELGGEHVLWRTAREVLFILTRNRRWLMRSRHPETTLARAY